MAVMGDASAEVWTDELRRAGRVVFPSWLSGFTSGSSSLVNRC